MGKSLIIKGANFSQNAISQIDIDPDKISVSVICNPIDKGTSTGSGIYTPSQQIQISITPNIGYQFSEWNDGNTDNPRTITVPYYDISYIGSVVQETEHEYDILSLMKDNYGIRGAVPVTDYPQRCRTEEPFFIDGRAVTFNCNTEHTLWGYSGTPYGQSTVIYSPSQFTPANVPLTISNFTGYIFPLCVAYLSNLTYATLTY